MAGRNSGNTLLSVAGRQSGNNFTLTTHARQYHFGASSDAKQQSLHNSRSHLLHLSCGASPYLLIFSGAKQHSHLDVVDAHAAQNDTLLDKMVLSAPAEPIFLVGVALGVLIAGAIFAINMRRWRAQQRRR